MKWLLNLYPPAWQRRYRAEMEIQLEAKLPRVRTTFDLLAGAIDAWAHPGWTPKSESIGGSEAMIAASRCETVDISTADAQRGAAWMIGLCLLLSGTGVILTKMFGKNIMTDALLYSTFFIALTISSRHTYLKPYSRRARGVLTIAVSIGWYAFFLAVGAL